MTLFEILLNIFRQSAGNIPALKATLQGIRDQFPDLAGALDPIIAALDAPATPENLVALATVVPPEVLNVLSGKIDPRPHAGDAI